MTPGEKSVIEEQKRIDAMSDEKLGRVGWTMAYILFGKRGVDAMIKEALKEAGKGEG